MAKPTKTSKDLDVAELPKFSMGINIAAVHKQICMHIRILQLCV